MPPSSTTATALSPTVFWPEGCTKDGLCYGWLRPAICVAGVLDDTTGDQNAKAFADDFSRSTLWEPLTNACGGYPTIIGRCKFDHTTLNSVPTSLILWNQNHEEYSFVLYRPHAADSLRFYVLEPPQHSPPTASSKADPYNALATYDFSRPRPRNAEGALNVTTIIQLNASCIAQTAASGVSVKLLPRTATLLLALASHLTFFSRLLLLFSKIVTSIVNIPVLPQPLLVFTEARNRPLTRYLRLKDISATAQQLDVRTEQALFFMTQITVLQRRNTHDVASYSVRYTNFFNTVWLIMNDITLGLAVGTFLSENSELFAGIANQYIQIILFHFPRTVLYWLDEWPAGLKLNAQLSRFYVNSLVGVIDTWDSSLPLLSPSFFTTMGFLSSLGGLTLLLSLLSDILSFFLTAHLRLGYELTRVVYWAAGVKLGGGLLWGVFRGKRRNVLRNRTDTWSYDIDQLLFGTVLFTLLAFLFPTALVYYVLFAGLRVATLLIQALIETLLAFMHHFPLFALMLWLKDPWRLPGGVYFALKTPSTPEHNAPARCVVSSYLTLESQWIPLSSIFFQYNELWDRLARHYNPLRLLYRVLSGQHLASIPPYSIRYASGPNPLTKEKTD